MPLRKKEITLKHLKASRNYLRRPFHKDITFDFLADVPHAIKTALHLVAREKNNKEVLHSLTFYKRINIAYWFY